VIFCDLTDSRLVGSELGETIEIYPKADDPEQARLDLLANEPGWSRIIGVGRCRLRSFSVWLPSSSGSCGGSVT
jgi:hypothetical protein